MSNTTKQRAHRVAEAAEILGHHKATTYRLIYSGQLKVIKNNGRIMIPSAEIERYLSTTETYSPKRKVIHNDPGF